MAMKLINPILDIPKSETVGQAILRALAEMVAEKFIEDQLIAALPNGSGGGEQVGQLVTLGRRGTKPRIRNAANLL